MRVSLVEDEGHDSRRYLRTNPLAPETRIQGPSNFKLAKRLATSVESTTSYHLRSLSIHDREFYIVTLDWIESDMGS